MSLLTHWLGRLVEAPNTVRTHRGRGSRFRPRFELLEDRRPLATFLVSNLNDSGAGSLRQAIVGANAAAGADDIQFTVAGTIHLASALPAVTGKMNLDGSTAPGFVGTPVVEIDYGGQTGLRFNTGAAGSTIQSLALVNGSGDGLFLHGRRITVVGNFIGLHMDGATVAANSGNGITIHASSFGNVIGGPTQPGSTAGNVISGNGGNGIAILGSAQNQVLGNFIGTDETGAIGVGNAKNGILLTNGAARNTIGGTTPSGEKFTGKAPDGNVISGNGANGVLLTHGAKANTLAANFIGTDLTGKVDIGNTLDGVAILAGANNNSLLGTFMGMTPFIFYNVISGNGGNGLRIHNANGTVVNANFFGLGSDNATPVPNSGNGVVVEGSSANTMFGGPIPLGNVVAANGQNGLVVKDTARGFLASNNFTGVGAFTNLTNLGNSQDGMLITSQGGNIVIKIGNIISRNGDDGIEISGAARGVQIVQNMIGLDTDGFAPMGNADNGIEVGGKAHDIVIGGNQSEFSVVPTGTISANGGYGIAVVGSAHDIQINFSYIGSDSFGQAQPEGPMALGNSRGGVLLGPGTHSTTIGSTNPKLHTVISGNQGDGVKMERTRGNAVLGTLIGTEKDGQTAMANAGSGIHIVNGSDNFIGGVRRGEANVIAFNLASGVIVQTGNRNGIRANSIHDNVLLGIDLGPGANRNQVAPILAPPVAVPGGVQLSGTVTSTRSTWVTIDLFANTDCDPSGFGEGQFLLGFVRVKTSASGLATFTFTALNVPPGATFFSATATDRDNNTSKFSSCV